jgi:hypothetical protein
MRNKCTALIRQAKSEYWKKEFEKSSNSKTFWRTVKRLKGDAKQNTIGSLNMNNEIITNPDEKAEAMNCFFSNIGKELAQKLQTEEDDQSHIYRVTPTISHINVDYNLFVKSFRLAVKPGKASGPDDIKPIDLKLCEESAIHGLFKVFQKSVTTGKFPNGKMQRFHASTKKGLRKIVITIDQFPFSAFRVR